MPHRLMALPDVAFYVTSAVATLFAAGSWLVGQVDAVAASVPPIPAGTIFAGLVAVITALSPLVLGAMDRKGLRAALRVANAERDQHYRRAERLEQFVVQQVQAGKIKLPPWFFDPAPPPPSTGEFPTIPPAPGPGPAPSEPTPDDED